MTVLRLEGLSKTFQRAGKVVDSIGLRIEHGEFFTLLGTVRLREIHHSSNDCRF